jgi:hypothetical protein
MPLHDKDGEVLTGSDSEPNLEVDLNSKDFNKLVSKKYLFPLERIHKPEWLKEIQNPLVITAEDIIRDLYKFVKDFPVEVIPHMTEDELIARSKERDIIKSKNFDSSVNKDHNQGLLLKQSTISTGKELDV